jgi:hypothetical protein
MKLNNSADDIETGKLIERDRILSIISNLSKSCGATSLGVLIWTEEIIKLIMESDQVDS